VGQYLQDKYGTVIGRNLGPLALISEVINEELSQVSVNI